MSDNQKQIDTDNDTQAEISRLQNTQKWLKGLLVMLSLISLVSISSLTAWLFTINHQVTSQQPESIDEISLQLENSQQRLQETRTRVTQYQRESRALLEEFAKGKGQQDQQRIEEIKKVLILQQKDYQNALDTLNKGMVDLANMVQGTRNWTKTYISGMKQAKRISEQRLQEIEDI